MRFRKGIGLIVGTSYLVLTILVAFHVHSPLSANATEYCNPHAHEGHAMHAEGYCPLAQYAAQAFLALPGSAGEDTRDDQGSTQFTHPPAHRCTSCIGANDSRGPPLT
ncbi:MAG: hypothetical protein C0600_05525 [Ignavibacteria bacterium]|nr:MAG: hypothetical protein C0600_05525 [Ignavibacteria bacterium]